MVSHFSFYQYYNDYFQNQPYKRKQFKEKHSEIVEQKADRRDVCLHIGLCQFAWSPAHACACAQLLSCVRLLQPQRLWPARLLCPWDSSDKNTRVGCHALFQGILLTQGWNLRFMSPALAGGFFTTNIT